MTNVERIYPNDNKIQKLQDAIIKAIEDHDDGMSVATVIGVLEISKQYVLGEEE